MQFGVCLISILLLVVNVSPVAGEKKAICTTVWFPFVTGTNDGKCPSNSRNLDGYSIQVWNKLAAHLCSTTGTLCSDDWEFVCMDQDDLIAELEKDYIESGCYAAAQELWIDPGMLENGIRFSLPTSESGFQILIHAATTTECMGWSCSIDFVFKPFTVQVWLLWVLMMVCSSIVVGFLEAWQGRTKQRFVRTRRHKTESTRSWDQFEGVEMGTFRRGTEGKCHNGGLAIYKRFVMTKKRIGAGSGSDMWQMAILPRAGSQTVTKDFRYNGHELVEQNSDSATTLTKMIPLKGFIDDGDIVWNDGTSSRPLVLLLDARTPMQLAPPQSQFHRCFEGRGCHEMRNSSWFGFSLFNGAGIGDPPKSFPARLLLFAMAFSCVIFVEIYSANMTSMLLLERTTLDSNIKDWPDLRGKTIGCYADSTDCGVLDRELNTNPGRQYNIKLVPFAWDNTEDESNFLKDLKDGRADQMCSEQIPEDCAACVSLSDCKGTKIDALVLDTSFVVGMDKQGKNIQSMEADCDFRQAPEATPLITFHQAIAVPRGTPQAVLDLINQGITDLKYGNFDGDKRPGLLDILKSETVLKQVDGMQSECERLRGAGGLEGDDGEQLGFNKMQGVLTFPLLMIAVSLVISAVWHVLSLSERAAYWVSFVLYIRSGASDYQTLARLKRAAQEDDFKGAILRELNVPECSSKNVCVMVNSRLAEQGIDVVEVEVAARANRDANLAAKLRGSIQEALADAAFARNLTNNFLAKYGLSAHCDQDQNSVNVEMKRLNNHPLPCYTFCYREKGEVLFGPMEPTIGDVYDLLQETKDIEKGPRKIWQPPADVTAPMPLSRMMSTSSMLGGPGFEGESRGAAHPATTAVRAELSVAAPQYQPAAMNIYGHLGDAYRRV